MKTRFKNIITTVFGLLIWGIDLAHLIVKLFFTDGFEADAKQVSIWVLIACFGYVFVMAKDTLIEGLTFKLLKIKKD